ncbi:hypothetical protein GGX14DRAFT_408948 [Mycena pura]|uniref:C2H2-type domain-containing protein n=1 Tax=Mycena pura TaxID=153505 RepID=A0AAD6US23_9AGAR|nr:hypothetical protein GGX14DRAFT_408948 [Mycena pura]
MYSLRLTAEPMPGLRMPHSILRDANAEGAYIQIPSPYYRILQAYGVGVAGPATRDTSAAPSTSYTSAAPSTVATAPFTLTETAPSSVDGGSDTADDLPMLIWSPLEPNPAPATRDTSAAPSTSYTSAAPSTVATASFTVTETAPSSVDGGSNTAADLPMRWPPLEPNPAGSARCAFAGRFSTSEVKKALNKAKRAPEYAFKVVACQWNNCGMTVRMDGMRGHLRDEHRIVSDKEKVRCRWAECKRKELLCAESLVRHLRSGMHLATALRCPTCNVGYMTVDALRGHLRGE